MKWSDTVFVVLQLMRELARIFDKSHIFDTTRDISINISFSHKTQFFSINLSVFQKNLLLDF